MSEIIHFIDNRRAIGVRPLNKSEDVMQFPVICAADFVEASREVGVTTREDEATCDDCCERLYAGQEPVADCVAGVR